MANRVGDKIVDIFTRKSRDPGTHVGKSNGIEKGYMVDDNGQIVSYYTYTENGPMGMAEYFGVNWVVTHETRP